MTWGLSGGFMSDHLPEQLVVCESYVYEMLFFSFVLSCTFILNLYMLAVGSLFIFLNSSANDSSV